ncbi:MAG: triose-phosphate isomerase [Flavobacteriales bacterium]|mgnify:CR=1 FL=1|jgi:triosephosphate isomerase (TIM)|nr:triose-phosphate isomerase [Flavobacteriales bacterium]
MKVVAGNWKMNMNYKEASALFNSLNNRLINDVEVILCPPSIYLSEFSNKLKNVKLAAQNVSSFISGAYTGEVSAQMLKNIGVDYCLIGHSERRALFNETNEVINTKIHLLLENEISPIFCCGESLTDRESGVQNEIIHNQLELGMNGLDLTQLQNCIIAYEPVWAIGTGLTATSDQAQEMHFFIRNYLKKRFQIENEILSQIPILYGGSCNAENASEIFSKNDVNGGLIGGAALKEDTFSSIIQSF